MSTDVTLPIASITIKRTKNEPLVHLVFPSTALFHYLQFVVPKTNIKYQEPEYKHIQLMHTLLYS